MCVRAAGPPVWIINGYALLSPKITVSHRSFLRVGMARWKLSHRTHVSRSSRDYETDCAELPAIFLLANMGPVVALYDLVAVLLPCQTCVSSWMRSCRSCTTCQGFAVN